MDDKDLVDAIYNGNGGSIPMDEVEKAYELVLRNEGLCTMATTDDELTDEDSQIKRILDERAHEYFPWISTLQDMIRLINNVVDENNIYNIVVHNSCVTGDLCIRIREGQWPNSTSTHYPVGQRLASEDVASLLGYLDETNIPYKITDNY